MEENTNIENTEVVETPVESPVETPVEATPEVASEPVVEAPQEPIAEPVADNPATNSEPVLEFEGELDKPELQAIAGAKPMTKESLEAYIEDLKANNPEKWERRREELEKKLADLS